MDKDQILKLVNDNPTTFTIILKHQYNSEYNFIDKNFSGRNFSEKLYKSLFLPITICKSCGGPTIFKNFFIGYRDFCSVKCMSLSAEIKNKKMHTILNNYNVKSPLQSAEILYKQKTTMFKRYGVVHALQLRKFREKSKKTCLHKHNDFTYNNPNKQRVTKLESFYEKLNNTDRLQSILPLFNLDEYDGVKNRKYKFECNKCSCSFEDHIDNGTIPICPECFPKSLLENEIVDFVKSLDINFIKNDRIVLGGNELDILISDANLAIEFNGLYWHGELNGKDKNYHLNKTLLCRDQGIRLIHIFEDEWLYKQDIVKNRLRHILGMSTERVYARNCIVKEISAEDKNNFLETYHIQGSDKSGHKLGLFHHQDQLVGVMTFGKRRLSLGKKKSEIGEYELIRFATSVNVIGGASKLLKYFIRAYEPKKIISYADLRWSHGHLYEKLGFENVGETKPNYWYINNRQKRFHRFNFRKSILNEKLERFDPEQTEWENMQLNGYDRIWDCGSLKYLMRFNRKF